MKPTGNLDSKNTLEIMNIIKAISREKLVILVTHEQQLARFYASRIVEMQDGKIIKDYDNDHSNELDYIVDNVFYLKDFKHHNKIEETNSNIDIYSNDNEKINLSIILKNGNIYIKSNTNKKIEVIDENSNIELIDDNYKKIDKVDIDNYSFDYKDLIDNSFNKKYTSILNIFTTITSGFKKVFGFSILKKILLAGFFLAGIFITYSVSTFFAATTIKDEDFVIYNKNYLIIDMPKINLDKYYEYEKSQNIEYMLPGDSYVKFNFPFDKFYQTHSMSGTLRGSLVSINAINESDLIYGRMPTNEYEIIVDKMAILNMNTTLTKMAGYLDIEDMLDKKVTISDMNDFKIVGITDLNSPSIYAYDSLFINIIYNSDYEVQFSVDGKVLLDYELLKDKIELKQGKLPINENEIIVNISNKDIMPLNKTINVEVNGKKLKVVGYYTSKYNYENYLTNNETIKKCLINQTKDMTVYPKDKNLALEEFKNYNLSIHDSYEYSKESYLDRKSEQIQAAVIASSTVLAISLVEIYLMIRSSFLSRIREIGIYRAIGVKKKDIYKMFIGEIFAITTLASLPGLLLMGYILEVLSGIKMLSSAFAMNINILLLAIIITYIFNLFVGLLPVFNTIRKTPAQILSRHDID